MRAGKVRFRVYHVMVIMAIIAGAATLVPRDRDLIYGPRLSQAVG